MRAVLLGFVEHSCAHLLSDPLTTPYLESSFRNDQPENIYNNYFWTVSCDCFIPGLSARLALRLERNEERTACTRSSPN